MQVRHRFGLFDEVCTSAGVQVRHCNWVRFLRVSENYGPQVLLSEYFENYFSFNYFDYQYSII